MERPGLPILFIEIKSSTKVTAENLSTFAKLTKDFDHCEAVCFSNDKYKKQLDNITVMPWRDGIKQFFTP